MNAESTKAQRLLWIDFETNGLYGMGYEVWPLEVGAVITDAEFTAVSEYTLLIETPQQVLDDLDDFATRMHTDNGLLDDMEKLPTEPIEFVDKDLSAFVAAHFPPKDQRRTIAEKSGYDYRGAVVAGSSVGSFDLRVLSEHFPATRALCSHRTYDISAVNEFAVRLGVDTVNTAATAGASTHRALADIYDSITKAKALTETLKGR